MIVPCRSAISLPRRETWQSGRERQYVKSMNMKSRKQINRERRRSKRLSDEANKATWEANNPGKTYKPKRERMAELNAEAEAKKEARKKRQENCIALKSVEARIAAKYACERSFQSMKVFLPNDVVEFHIGKKTLFRHSNKQCYPMELDEFLARLKV